MATFGTDSLVDKLIDGRYLILDEIARGGMATVYRAHDERLDRVVAVKIMHPHLGTGSEVTARFRREARAAAGLSHPNVVSVFDQGMSSDGAYLAMEYINGSNLRDWVRAEPDGMEVASTITIIQEILQALEAAHEAGIVHRDIKPENILISQKGAIKVADFGLARAVSEATASLTGSLLGTIAYVAPEVVMSGEAGATSDLYSLGVMWFELLTGRQPFDSEEPLHIAFQHVHNDMPAVSEYRSDVDPAFVELIRSMTAREPADRIQSATAVLARIDSITGALALATPSPKNLATEVLGRSPASPASSGTQPLVEHPRPVMDQLTTDLSQEVPPGTSLAAAAPAQGRPSPQVRKPRKPRRRRRTGLAVILLVLILALGAGAGWYFLEGPGSYTDVPAIAGEREQVAQEILTNVGFEVNRATAHDDVVPAGHIISSEPAGDEAARRGSEVSIVVSLGVLMVTMPEVIELPLEQVLEEIDVEGFSQVPEIERQYHASIPADHVISSNIDAGEELRHDALINLVVSDGREPVTMPDVAEAELEETVAQLKDLGLEVDVLEAVFSETIPEGHIVEVSAAQELYVGDTVKLTPSKGPELFIIPNVQGNRYNSAKAQLEGLGFEVHRENLRGGIFGLVRDQSPAAGTAHPRGTIITLTVV